MGSRLICDNSTRDKFFFQAIFFFCKSAKCAVNLYNDLIWYRRIEGGPLLIRKRSKMSQPTVRCSSRGVSVQNDMHVSFQSACGKKTPLFEENFPAWYLEISFNTRSYWDEHQVTGAKSSSVVFVLSLSNKASLQVKHQLWLLKVRWFQYSETKIC